MIRLYPPPAPGEPPPEAEPASIYDGVELPAAAGRPGVALNMVSTVDGKTTLGRGRVRGPIGSRVDRELMRRLRAGADAVARGAGTLRANPRYPKVPDDLAAARARRGEPPQPLLVVVSGSCDLPLDAPAFAEAPRRPVVLTTRAADPRRVAAARERADVVVAGEDGLDLPEALAWLLRERGVRRLLLEGGPTLNHAFLAAGMVDELFWTVAPKVAGYGEDLTLVHGPRLLEPMPALELVTAWFHGGELFLRYRVVGGQR